MALLTYADRVAETTITTGTGTISLLGASDAKFRTFVAGAGGGNTVPYVIVHRTANEYEVGFGVVTSGSPDTLTRGGVYASSTGSAINFSAGTKDVFLSLPASKTARFNDATDATTLTALTVTGNVTVDTNTLFVDAANNRVGIGTGSFAADAKLQVAGGRAYFGANGNVFAVCVAFNDARAQLGQGYYLGAADSATPALVFSNTDGTPRMTLDASGKLGLGTSAPNNALHIQRGAGVGAFIDCVGNGNTAGSSNVVIGQGDDDNGYFWNRKSAFLSFGTNNTERARITSGGYLKASNDGTYLASTAAYHELRQAANEFGVILTAPIAAYTSTLIYGDVSGTVGGSGFDLMQLRASGAAQFVVRGDGNVTNTNNSYGQISDLKTKQDVVDAASQWDDLKAVRVRKFRFKNNADGPLQIGVVAQELEQTSPGLVDESPDYKEVKVEVEIEKSRVVMHEVEEIVTDAEGVESVVMKFVPMLDEDGKEMTETYTETETRTEREATGTVTKSVKYSVLYMKAVGALQEAMARIESLEARLDALES